MNDMMNKIEALMKDEAFFAQLQEVSTKDEIMELFAANGAAMTDADFNELGAQGIALLKEQGHIGADGELSPEMLELVSGGGKVGSILLLTGLAFASAWAGCPEGTVLCIIAGYAVLKS